MHILLMSLLFTLLATAKMDLYPKQECELFNNLKHTKNRGNEVLKLDRIYEMLKHHKGQYLLKVEDATPSQRWVDDDCLTLRPLINSPLHPLNKVEENKKSEVKETNIRKVKKVSIDKELAKASVNNDIVLSSKHNIKVSTQNLLVISWHNTFCETHRYKKECKRTFYPLGKSRYSEKNFVLHGLWPQPRSKVYCNVNQTELNFDKHKQWNRLSKLNLSDEVRKDLNRVMPAVSSNLHKHEWIKHGTCYGTDANTYYKDSIRLVEQINHSKVGNFFSKNIGKRVTLQQVRSLFDRSFGQGSGKRVQMQCKKGLVSELWLHLGSGSDDLGTLLKRGKRVKGRCFSGQIDKAGFGR